MSQYLDNTGLATLWSKIKSVFAEKASTLAGYGITDAQAALVSGTNIKTVNGESLLGSGNITVEGSGGIVFEDTYVSDCNAWLTNGYTKVSRNDTTNQPSLCTDEDKWGILFFIAENASEGTGTQMYFPIAGTYKGRVFVRSLTAIHVSSRKSIGAWNLIPLMSDISTKANSADVYTKTEVDGMVGDIESILSEINGGTE